MGSTRRILGKVRGKLVPKRPLNARETRQFIEWVRANKRGEQTQVPDFLRRTKPEERLATVVTKRARFGGRILLHQLASVPQTGFERQELGRTLKEIREKWKDRFSTKKIETLLAKAKVLQTSAVLGASLGGRNPTVYQVLALTALRHGLGSEELVQAATKMLSEYRHKRSSVTWEGNPSHMYTAIKFRLQNHKLLLPEMERILFDAKGNALDSKTFATLHLKLGWTKPTYVSLNGALQLLETAGLVKKMPPAPIGLKGRALTVWTHTAYQNPPINYPNVSMDILKRLKKGKQTGTFFYKPHNTRGHSISGNPNATFTATPVLKTLEKMKESGLIYISDEKTKTKTRGRSYIVELTDLGRRLIEEHDGTGHLPEWGRKLLLGEKEENQT